MGVNASIGHTCRPKSQRGSRGIEPLIRRLVAQAKQAETFTSPSADPKDAREDSSEKVLLTCEVDGVRCILARVPSFQTEGFSLSPREQEIARMIAKGYPNKTIAAVLEISVWTVSTHLRRVFAKFSVNSRAAMVAKMISHRML